MESMITAQFNELSISYTAVLESVILKAVVFNVYYIFCAFGCEQEIDVFLNNYQNMLGNVADIANKISFKKS